MSGVHYAVIAGSSRGCMPRLPLACWRVVLACMHVVTLGFLCGCVVCGGFHRHAGHDVPWSQGGGL